MRCAGWVSCAFALMFLVASVAWAAEDAAGCRLELKGVSQAEVPMDKVQRVGRVAKRFGFDCPALYAVDGVAGIEQFEFLRRGDVLSNWNGLFTANILRHQRLKDYVPVFESYVRGKGGQFSVLEQKSQHVFVTYFMRVSGRDEYGIGLILQDSSGVAVFLKQTRNLPTADEMRDFKRIILQ